ncbi:hypothetical protein ACQEPB_09130 [Novosphingobium fluoreni]|uniref:hypothetical protein n=1 Tax=Novosphingobium fluoreni TaxID=1391222 RepID=UPI003DA18646
MFQAAFTQLRSSAGGTLKVLPGEYHFKTGRQTEQAGLANLLISKLNDVEIDATGAKFLFEAGCDGVFIEDSRRIRLRGAVMEDPSELSGYGRMKLVDGTMRLILDKPLPAGLSINWVQAMNEGADRSWPQIQAKAIIPPTDPQAVRIDDRTFTAPGFKALADGQMVSVKYTWYGKRAIFIRDTNKGFSEDVIFDGVHIGSVGGIAVMLKTRGRGFAVVNSTLSASTGRPYSSNYDGLHVISAGGDILIRNNAFAHTGDDLVNLRSIIHKVSNIKPNSVTLSNDARMMRVGDEVAFFTATGEYIGRRMISSAPPLGNSDTIARPGRRRADQRSGLCSRHQHHASPLRRGEQHNGEQFRARHVDPGPERPAEGQYLSQRPLGRHSYNGQLQSLAGRRRSDKRPGYRQHVREWRGDPRPQLRDRYHHCAG